MSRIRIYRISTESRRFADDLRGGSALRCTITERTLLLLQRHEQYAISPTAPRKSIVVPDGGSADAMDNLATMYLFGIGLSRDPVNALRWYVRSAARGNVHSIYSVAVMAEKGLGTSRNVQLARAMYRRAAESGFTPAMIRVSEDYARGSGGKRDLIEAYAWLQVALQSGLPEELQIAALASMEEFEARLVHGAIVYRIPTKHGPFPYDRAFGCDYA
jgi:TPR repeat protein